MRKTFGLEEWLRRFATEIVDPSVIASAIWALPAAIVSILVAWRLLLRTLSHDRQLGLEARDAERENAVMTRRAERREQAAREVADVVADFDQVASDHQRLASPELLVDASQKAARKVWSILQIDYVPGAAVAMDLMITFSVAVGRLLTQRDLAWVMSLDDPTDLRPGDPRPVGIYEPKARADYGPDFPIAERWPELVQSAAWANVDLHVRRPLRRLEREWRKWDGWLSSWDTFSPAPSEPLTAKAHGYAAQAEQDRLKAACHRLAEVLDPLSDSYVGPAGRAPKRDWPPNNTADLETDAAGPVERSWAGRAANNLTTIPIDKHTMFQLDLIDVCADARLEAAVQSVVGAYITRSPGSDQ